MLTLVLNLKEWCSGDCKRELQSLSPNGTSVLLKNDEWAFQCSMNLC